MNYTPGGLKCPLGGTPTHPSSRRCGSVDRLPLASLDAARKSEIMPHLTRLTTALKLPLLYVTHALDEAASPLSEIAARGDRPLIQEDGAVAHGIAAFTETHCERW